MSFPPAQHWHVQCLVKHPSLMTHRAILPGIALGLSTVYVVRAANFLQPPGHFGGFGSDGSVFSVADDFQYSETTPVRGLAWWGGYFNPSSEPDEFTVRLYADDKGRPGEGRSNPASYHP